MKKISVLILSICVLVFSLSSLLFAQEERELMQSAIKSIEAGEFILAQKTLAQVQFILWNISPMTIENATFTEGGKRMLTEFFKKELPTSFRAMKRSMSMLNQNISFS